MWKARGSLGDDADKGPCGHWGLDLEWRNGTDDVVVDCRRKVGKWSGRGCVDARESDRRE